MTEIKAILQDLKDNEGDIEAIDDALHYQFSRAVEAVAKEWQNDTNQLRKQSESFMALNRSLMKLVRACDKVEVQEPIKSDLKLCKFDGEVLELKFKSGVILKMSKIKGTYFEYRIIGGGFQIWLNDCWNSVSAADFIKIT